MLVAEPMRALALNENEEPNCTKFNTLSESPKRANPRTLSALPTVVAPKMLVAPAMSLLPNTLRLEPSLNDARSDMELPKFMESKIETLEPNVALLKMLIELPHRPLPLSDIVLPSMRASKTEREAPNRPALRTDKDDPRWQKLITDALYALPKRIRPMQEAPEPMRVKPRMLIVLPM
jgi:hypothetical protein